MMKRYFLLLLSFIFFVPAGFAINFSSPPTANSSDTIVAQELVMELASGDMLFGERIVRAAESFIGKPSDDYYMKDSTAVLRINLESATPLMLVNNAIALAKASQSPGNPSWRNFVSSFQDISCRKGEDEGFPSIMYHTSDWINDNSFRGNLKELTENFSGNIDKMKSLDEMTRYRNKFAALHDSLTFEKVRMTEMGFRTHRVPVLKKETIKNKDVQEDLKDGDIIILVPNRDGIDMYDMGIVVIRNDGPHLIHVHPQTNVIEETPDNLMRYFPLMTKYFQGYRIIRPLE